jgi:hypothetical protein
MQVIGSGVQSYLNLRLLGFTFAWIFAVYGTQFLVGQLLQTHGNQLIMLESCGPIWVMISGAYKSLPALLDGVG